MCQQCIDRVVARRATVADVIGFESWPERAKRIARAVVAEEAWEAAEGRIDERIDQAVSKERQRCARLYEQAIADVEGRLAVLREIASAPESDDRLADVIKALDRLPGLFEEIDL